MKKLLLNISIGLITLVALSGVAQAGETKISGFVDMSYFSDPNSDTATFGMDQAEVDIEHSIDEKASMRIDLEYSDDGNVATTDAAIEQGYININVGAVTLTFGKFNAPIGFELLDAPDMYQYSHALVFNYGLPTNLTGAMVSGGSGMIDYAIYYVNGWDNNYDTNTDKHIGTRIGITPMEMLNVGLSYISGNIGTGASKVAQTITDIDLTYTPSERFTLGAEYNMGTVKEASNVTAGDDASWNGFMVMAHYDFNDTYGLTLRYGSFNDEDDYAINAGAGKETRTATTVAFTFGIADGLGGLIEMRSDKSDKDVFTDKDGNPKDNESTLAAELTYSF